MNVTEAYIRRRSVSVYGCESGRDLLAAVDRHFTNASTKRSRLDRIRERADDRAKLVTILYTIGEDRSLD